MKGAHALGLAFALLSAPSAEAEPPPDDPYSRKGFYFSLGGYYQKENFNDTCDEEFGDACVDGFRPDSSGGVGVKLGYRFHRYFAAEAHYEWVKEALEDSFGKDGHLATLNVKAIYPLRWFQPFALIGGGYMRFPVPKDPDRNFTTENGVAFRFGGGFDLYVTEHWALLAEASYVQPTTLNDLDTVPFLSVGGGFQYRF